MPAEWGRHARTILAWPSRNSKAYPSARDLEAATNDVSSIAEAVARFEPVTLIVDNERAAEASQRFARARTGGRHPVQLHPIAADGLDLWMRDIAPTFVVGEGPVNPAGEAAKACPLPHGVDFNFNGWGNRHPAQDCLELARSFLQSTSMERIQASIVTEGGALEVDGQGTLLATESSIINENRNQGKSRQVIENELRRCLGVSKVIWVPGVKGVDTTDCHIDALVRFARPGVVLLSRPTGPPDAVWARVYEKTREILSCAVDAEGRSLEMIDVQEPHPDVLGLGEEATTGAEPEGPPVTSYVNYLLVNGGIIVPQFGDKKADASAMATLGEVFGPSRRAVGVYIDELPFLGGGIHCATQQIPLPGNEPSHRDNYHTETGYTPIYS